MRRMGQFQLNKSVEPTTTDGISRSGWNVSGALEYDTRGRTVAEGQPVFSPGSANPAPPAMVNPTRTLYDTADRPTRITLPDGSLTSYAYGIRSSTTLTDPQGRITETVSGLPVSRAGEIVWLLYELQDGQLHRSSSMFSSNSISLGFNAWITLSMTIKQENHTGRSESVTPFRAEA